MGRDQQRNGQSDGIAATAGLLADAFSSLHGDVELVEPAPVERVLADGIIVDIEHGRHLVAPSAPKRRCNCCLPGIWTPFFRSTTRFRISDGAMTAHLNGPGVADMKGGIAVMLAALSAAETAP